MSFLRKYHFHYIYIIVLTIFLFPHITKDNILAQSREEEPITIILEVDGKVNEAKNHVEKFYPSLEVVATYEKLFSGIALKGEMNDFDRIRTLDFVKAIHPVQQYTTLNFNGKKRLDSLLNQSDGEAVGVLPNALNDTKYTGKGIKVGVVDTGIDYEHPDLKANFRGGYDTVDLDDDPMETTPDQGEPTLHGSHVAGIIAANGNLLGVAPDAELYGYRALGPGGSGTSVQVIAAMEEAVNDGVDIINLSLGNNVNGPDYPTSLAVNRAIELGVAVVVANGNDGPDNWTVGAPATATKALGIGASTAVETIPYLEETLNHRKIDFNPLIGAAPWTIEKGEYVANYHQSKASIQNKLVIVDRDTENLLEVALEIEQQGAKAILIANNEEGLFQAMLEESMDIPKIPIVAISKEDGDWLKKRLKSQSALYLDNKTSKQPVTIAPFSSRGPVTANWEIKPDIIAPGTKIISTVPGGYERLQGTSMATPHVAGVIALLMEAHPDWSIEELFGALRTSAERVSNDGKPLDPIVQGMGLVKPQAAIDTQTIIDKPLLSFGKINETFKENKTSFTIENKSSKTQQYRFLTTKKERGLTWNMPSKFTLKPKEQREIKLSMRASSNLIEKGLHQGWITLERDKSKTYHLPYVWMNQTADHPRAMGLEFELKPFTKDDYTYKMFLSDDVESLDVHLYNPETLIREKQLLRLDDVKTGLNEGQLSKNKLPQPGIYLVILTAQLTDGSYKSYNTQIEIAP